MKIISSALIFLLSTLFSLMAQDVIPTEQRPAGFQVQQLDGDFEMGSFKEIKGVHVLEIKDTRAPRKNLPAPELTYQLVKAHLAPKVVMDWDQLDYDRFYIRLISMKTTDLIRIYEGTTIKQLEALKLEFKKYE